jgi:hypothetical protein
VSLAVLNGKITIGDSKVTHDAFHTLVLSADDQETGVSVTALEGNTDFVLVWIILWSEELRALTYVDCGRAARPGSRAVRPLRDDHKGGDSENIFGL